LQGAFILLNDREKILIADDEPGVVAALETLLSDDYQVFSAETGAEAWKILQEEQIAVAEIAARKTDWAGAIELLNGLLDQARSDKNTQRVTDLQQRISKYRYQLAVKYFDDGEWEQAIQEAGNVARTDKDQPTAPLAADLAGQAALKLFLAADATAKPTALGRLKNIVNFSSETWPDLEVAGNGQLILAEAYLFQNDLDNVMQILDRITHQQHVAPTVAMAAGRLYYKMYVDQRKKPGSDESEKQLQLLRENADRTFSIALAALPTPDPIQPEGRMASEAQILRAELLLDSQQPEAASKCIEPLYTVISATSGPTSDALLIRIATIALRTQLLMKDVERAPGTAEVLMQFNVDQPAANSALVQVASLLAKRVLVEEKENQDAPKVMQLGEEPRDRKLLKELVKHLASRTQLNQRQMISVAEQSAALELWEPILLIAKSFFSQFDSDATFRAAANDGQPKMRLLYARALRRTDDAEAARQQIEVLVKEHPERLDALLEQVRILEQLSKSNTKYCQACVEQGTKLRKLLSRIQPRRPEYYEVILATARCLLLQSKKSKGGEQIKQAEQLLKATLTLSPDLSGPQMQEQYRKLLREITEVRATAK
jgi:CheY-like chemotaxis protein